jgi:hypothetical protein
LFKGAEIRAKNRLLGKLSFYLLHLKPAFNRLLIQEVENDKTDDRPDDGWHKDYQNPGDNYNDASDSAGAITESASH